MKYFFLFFLTCLFSFSQNQEAKIFLHNNETREGFAMINSKDEIVFKTSLEAKPVTLNSTEVTRIEFY